MLPGAAGTEVAGPCARHFRLAVVVPVFSSPSPGMMGNFPDGNRGIAIPAEPGRHIGSANCFVTGTAKKRPVVPWAVTTCQEGVTGGPTGGSLNVMPVEGPSPVGQRINVWRMDIVGPKAL